MKLAIMQPYFFPYVGYFQLIHAVDKFIFYDDVSFIKKGWIHRNNILINQEPFLFSVPCVGASQNKLIIDTKINFDLKEKQKFLKRIELAYKKAPSFDDFYPGLEAFMLQDESDSISSLASESILFTCDYLGLKRTFAYSSIDHSSSRGLEKEARLIEISKKEKAVSYFNSEGGKQLYSKSNFREADIDLHFVMAKKVPYRQYGDSFVPWLSIIDLLMFNSVDQANQLILQYSIE